MTWLNKTKKVVVRLRGYPLNMTARIEMLRKLGMKIGDRGYIGNNVSFDRGGCVPIEIGNDCFLTGCTVLRTRYIASIISAGTVRNRY